MCEMTKFGERLNERMIDVNVSVFELAEIIGVSLATIYRWKNNESKILMSNLVRLVKVLDCSVDFLLGRSDDVLLYNPNLQLPLFSLNLRKVMKECGVSTYKLRQKSRFDGKYFQKWDRGTDPNALTLCELADILDCSVDYLIGREI